MSARFQFLRVSLAVVLAHGAMALGVLFGLAAPALAQDDGAADAGVPTDAGADGGAAAVPAMPSS